MTHGLVVHFPGEVKRAEVKKEITKYGTVKSNIVTATMEETLHGVRRQTLISKKAFPQNSVPEIPDWFA